MKHSSRILNINRKIYRSSLQGDNRCTEVKAAHRFVNREERVEHRLQKSVFIVIRKVQWEVS